MANFKEWPQITKKFINSSAYGSMKGCSDNLKEIVSPFLTPFFALVNYYALIKSELQNTWISASFFALSFVYVIFSFCLSLRIFYNFCFGITK
jgi:hypothetical protein